MQILFLFFFPFGCFFHIFTLANQFLGFSISRLANVFKTSSRHVFNTSSRHVFKKSWRCLERNNFLSSKTSSRRLQDVSWDVFKTSSKEVFKTPSRRLENVLENKKLLRWRRVEDVFKTCLQDFLKINECLLGLY